MQTLTEHDFADVASKTTSGDFRGAVTALASIMVTALTGHPILGSLVKPSAEALAKLGFDDAMDRALKAGKEFDEERVRTVADQRSVQEAVKPLLALLWDQSAQSSATADEQFLQLCTLLMRYAARQEDLCGMLQAQIDKIAHGFAARHEALSAPGADLSATPWMDGPVTLSAELDSHRMGNLSAYPTGIPGAHLVFDVYNANRDVDFSVSYVSLYVAECSPVKIGRLVHGVGATDVVRNFRGELPSRPGKAKATYQGAPGEFVKVLRGGGTDRFDVEVHAATEGLYRFRLHVVGNMGVKRCEVPIADEGAIVFFRKDGDYTVDWSPRTMRYREYIEELTSHAAFLSAYGP